MSEDPLPAYRHDPELIDACLSGDRNAWNELINRYARLVYSIPRRYGFSSQDTEDIFQNVFTIVFQRLDSLRNRKLLAAWLITITQHECQRVFRSKRETQELDESAADTTPLTAHQIELWERQHLVRQAIEQLDPECRQLITALFLDPQNPSYQDVATMLNLPVGSIGPNRARCFKKLEAILAKMGLDL
jgi:RNA polymerase sigma factor (sigma-70 family)